MKKWKCDKCKKEVERFKDLKKVLKKKLCKECYTKNRLDRREETIENSQELKEDLRILKNKEAKYYRIKRIGTERKPGRPKAEEKDFPTIKGSRRTGERAKSESYLGFNERQILLKILMGRGMDFEEAKTSIQETKKELEKTREKLKQEGKSEEQIKIKQQEMLEELWN